MFRRSQDWTYAEAWLAGYGIQHLVIDRGHLLDLRLAKAAFERADRLGLQLTLLASPQDWRPTARRGIDALDPRRSSWSDLLRALPTEPAQSEPVLPRRDPVAELGPADIPWVDWFAYPAALAEYPDRAIGDRLEEEQDGDAVLLESLLFTAGKRIHLDAVASVTGWSVERARAAADKLQEQLGDRGIRLNRTGRTCGLRPRVDTRTKEQLSAIERQVAIRDGLLLPEAAILHKVWRQELTGSSRAVVRDARTRLAAARLINLGVIIMRPTHSAKVIEEGETRTVRRFRLGTDVLMALAPVWQPSHRIEPVQPISDEARPV